MGYIQWKQEDVALDFLYYALAGLVGLAILILAARALRRLVKRAIWLGRYGDEALVDTMMAGRIERGMTLDMVLDVWGTPADMDETVLKTKTRRELKYDQKGKNRFGTRVHLENGEVVGLETK